MHNRKQKNQEYFFLPIFKSDRICMGKNSVEKYLPILLDYCSFIYYVRN